MKTKTRGINKAIFKNTKGFTLVELIVVLVILAILAALLVPQLLGWIDNARVKQDMIDAKNCLTATQAELTKLYASRKDGGEVKSVIDGQKGLEIKNEGTNRDVDATKTDFGKAVLKTADDSPYILVVGLGSTKTYAAEKDRRKQYTVYLVMYQKKKDSKPIYFYGDEWGLLYPTDVRLKAVTGGQKNPNRLTSYDIDLQYYVIANKDKKGVGSDIWKHLKDNSDWKEK